MPAHSRDIRANRECACIIALQRGGCRAPIAPFAGLFGAACPRIGRLPFRQRRTPIRALRQRHPSAPIPHGRDPEPAAAARADP